MQRADLLLVVFQVGAGQVELVYLGPHQDKVKQHSKGKHKQPVQEVAQGAVHIAAQVGFRVEEEVPKRLNKPGAAGACRLGAKLSGSVPAASVQGLAEEPSAGLGGLSGSFSA